MTPYPFVGIDPGGVETGVVLRRGDELLDHHTINESDPRLHIHRVTDAIGCCLDQYAGAYIAVEDLNEPNPHLGITNVRGLIGTARTLGAVLALYPRAILVPPGGNGSGPLVAYPEALRPTRGSGRGKDQLRHCRSAYDVAGAARTLLRQRAAS